MKKRIFLLQLTIFLPLLTFFLNAQGFEAGNKIKITVKFSSGKRSASVMRYRYMVLNSIESKQKVWRFYLMTKVSRNDLSNITSILHWKTGLPEKNGVVSVRWGTASEEGDIAPNEQRGGFGLESPLPPGIIDYYAEGYHDLPNFEEGMATDSIPGYTDLTPYGPGVVGKTIGPVVAPNPFVALVFLDTIIAYKNQATVLGWLGSKKEDDKEKDDDELRELDKRLAEARKTLVKGDSSKARKKLEEFVEKVEEIYKESVKAEEKKKEQEIIMTSEAYALLKFNAEYLINKLPKKKK